MNCMTDCESMFIAAVHDPSPPTLDRFFEKAYPDFTRVSKSVFFRYKYYMENVGMEPADILSEIYLNLHPCMHKWIEFHTENNDTVRLLKFQGFLPYSGRYTFCQIRDDNRKRIDFRNGASVGIDPLYSGHTASLSSIGKDDEDDNYGYESLAVDPTGENGYRSIEEKSFQKCLTTTLDVALDTIPNLESRCIKSVYLDGKTMMETSDIMQTNVETVKLSVRSGLMRLRQIDSLKDVYKDLK